ncbi:phosphoribosylglycinamide formyltransferase [Virgibacillus byunsanensis]|uniref:Phosphoribosylglycinamide formyltransferase n=1 Tax=Virgibacillus byunsanensis TaxID=570945 RepID=A0ABW3LGX3_9BACI
MTSLKAAVFASGTGSNFQAIMESDDLMCDIVLLVCDKPDASVIDKANHYGVPTYVFNPKEYATKANYEEQLVRRLHDAEVSWIFLAGYMRIAGTTLLEAFVGKIINIHPSYLPAFPGKDAIGQAFRAGVEKTGVTVHYIDEGIDTGPIIEQVTVPIFPEDTEEMLKQRIQRIEHQLYPKVINQLIQVK